MCQRVRNLHVRAVLVVVLYGVSMSWDEKFNLKPADMQLILDGMDERGESDVKEAIAWIQEHPETWRSLMSKAVSSTRLQRMRGNNSPRMSMRYLSEISRWEHGVGIKNALTPALARIAEVQEPELKDCFSKHRSRSDGHVKEVPDAQ